MMRWYATALVALAVLLGACSGSSGPDDAAVAALESRVAELEQAAAERDAEIMTLQTQLAEQKTVVDGDGDASAEAADDDLAAQGEQEEEEEEEEEVTSGPPLARIFDVIGRNYRFESLHPDGVRVEAFEVRFCFTNAFGDPDPRFGTGEPCGTVIEIESTGLNDEPIGEWAKMRRGEPGRFSFLLAGWDIDPPGTEAHLLRVRYKDGTTWAPSEPAPAE